MLLDRFFIKSCFIFLGLTIYFHSLMAQTKQHNQMKENQNPLICNPQIGACEVPDSTNDVKAELPGNTQQLKLIYFTDPICSSCWGIEPQLKKLKLEYGQKLEIEYHMGGLLPDWSYNSGGISKPSDVAHHWDEVSAYYDMPIDGDVWLEDPLPSSYPPSIAFKAAQLQNKNKALIFLRLIREMVFLQKKNITQWEHISIAASQAGLDTLQLKQDFAGKARNNFEDDLKLSKQYGVRGFPTVFVTDHKGNKEIVYGARPYEQYEAAIKRLEPGISKSKYSNEIDYLFQQFDSYTLREFSEISGYSKMASEQMLNDWEKQHKLQRISTKNGNLWRKINY